MSQFGFVVWADPNFKTDILSFRTNLRKQPGNSIWNAVKSCERV
jgi:hypothetical protein